MRVLGQPGGNLEVLSRWALSQTIELGVPASLPPRLLVNDSELKYLSTGLWN
jgi:hypothetical protein